MKFAVPCALALYRADAGLGTSDLRYLLTCPEFFVMMRCILGFPLEVFPPDQIPGSDPTAGERECGVINLPGSGQSTGQSRRDLTG